MKRTKNSTPEQMPERVAAGAPGTATQPARSTVRSRPAVTHIDTRGRGNRDDDNRAELFERIEEDRDYIRPTSTEAPDPLPGMKQRWCHVGYEGKVDEKNLNRKLREGWRARPAGTVPRSFHVPRMAHGRFAGTVMVEGLILMQMPIKLAKKREAYYRELTQLKTDAVNESLMRVNEGARGGFGPIKVGKRSELKPTSKAEPRNTRAGQTQQEDSEVDLT